MSRPLAVPSTDVGDGRRSRAASVGEDAIKWLLLTYRLPAKPASLRAVVRRKLSAAGAVYLSPACAVAPLSAPAERPMRRLRATITGAGGSAVLLTGRALAGQLDLTAAFNAVHDLEYADIIIACDDAMASLEALTEAREFRYQPLWDKDIVLRRLTARYRAVRGRDPFGTGKAEAAAAALARYRCSLNEYGTRFYAADSHS